MPIGVLVLLNQSQKNLPGHPNTVYGPGHQLTVNDSGTVDVLLSEGKAQMVAPAARAITVTAVGTTTATVTFTVDEFTLVARVYYGTTPTADTTFQASTPASGSGVFVANLTGLTTATLYYYKVAIFDAAGSNPTYSNTATFRTL